jgi:cytochrome c-type biogenesis protein CcmE
MDPARKRKIRLVIALSAAVLLAVALVYTSFSAATEAKKPSDLLGTPPAGKFELTGKVVPGTITHKGEHLDFRVADRDDPSKTVPVDYEGTVPDPFRDGREIVVTGALKDGTVVGERDSLITKCPSKFTDKPSTAAPGSGS